MIHSIDTWYRIYTYFAAKHNQITRSLHHTLLEILEREQLFQVPS